MNKRINLYVICLTLLILECAYSYLTLSLLQGLKTIVSLVAMISFLIIYKDRKKLSMLAISIFLFVCIGEILSHHDEMIFWVIVSPISKLPLLTLFLLKHEDLKRVANSLTTIFSFLITVSLCLWGANKLIDGLPSLGKDAFNQYDIVNYFYFYIDVTRYEGAFSGFCIETGYFSLLCICLLSLNKFDFSKKSTIVFAISIILSMSLEGYLLLVIGYFLSIAAKNGSFKKFFIYSFMILCVGVIVCIVALNYNNGDNILAKKILERLVLDEELGIAGNNRENYIVKPIVDSIFYSKNIWFGVGFKNFFDAVDVKDADICSWRVFVCVHGVIYTILLFLLSLFCLSKTKIKYTLPFFIIFWLDFYPHGNPFSEVMYFIVILFLQYSNNTVYSKKIYTSR